MNVSFMQRHAERLCERHQIAGWPNERKGKGNDAIGQLAYLVGLLKEDNVDQKWIFEMIAGISLAQPARCTPQRKPYLRLVTEE